MEITYLSNQHQSILLLGVELEFHIILQFKMPIFFYLKASLDYDLILTVLQ